MQREVRDKLATAQTAVTALARVLAETKELPFALCCFKQLISFFIPYKNAKL